MISFIAGSTILKRVWGVLSMSLSVPIWLMIIGVLGASTWVYIDRSQVKAEAEEALVSAAEVAAAEAALEAQKRITAASEEMSSRLREANKRLDDQLAESRRNWEMENAKIKEAESRPVNPHCVLDGDLYSRLRAK